MSDIYPEKVLAVTDGSEVSDKALRIAAELCQKTGSELHLVMVGLLSQWTHPDTLSAAQYQRLQGETRARLDKEVEKARAAGGTVAQAHLKMGMADVEVIRLSEALPAGLIVVANRGRGSIERILLGNDAESIVRHAPCTVMVVR